MSKRPTPETDAVRAYEGNWDTKALRMTAHARKLERERDEAKEKYDTLATEHMLVVNKLCEERDEAREEIRDWKRLHDAAERGVDLTIAEGTISDLLKQRDEAREQIKELIYIAGRAIALAEIDFENDKFGVVSELRYGLEKIMEASK